MVYEDVVDLIINSNNIVFFGGAGVSTESGIPDFRSATGLYNQKNDTGFSPEYMLSHDFLVTDNEGFSKYFKTTSKSFRRAKINTRHAVAKDLAYDYPLPTHYHIRTNSSQHKPNNKAQAP